MYRHGDTPLLKIAQASHQHSFPINERPRSQSDGELAIVTLRNRQALFGRGLHDGLCCWMREPLFSRGRKRQDLVTVDRFVKGFHVCHAWLTERERTCLVKSSLSFC